jgi:hypothetical protein
MRRLVAVLIVMIVAAGAVLHPQQAQFRAGVDVVMLNVAVTDGKKNIADLTAADFEVLDNGVPQEVVSVARETWPIDLMVLMQTSLPLTWWGPGIVLDAVDRVRGRLKLADRMSLVTFNRRIREQAPLAPVTEYRRPDPVVREPQTSIFDALATVYATRPIPGRRQMALIFIDTVDSSSVLDEADVLEMAKRSPVATFVVSRLMTVTYVSGPDASTTTRPFLSQPNPGPHPLGFLYRVTATTGGAVNPTPGMRVTQSAKRVTIGANRNLVDEDFIRIIDDFRASYVLHYSLAGVPRAGWHEVTVKVKRPGSQKYRVRARNGYVGG